MTETRTYLGETDAGAQAPERFMGLVIGQCYTGAHEGVNLVRVTAEGAPVESGVLVTSVQWGKWFRR
jgi:hypothetical protein